MRVEVLEAERRDAAALLRRLGVGREAAGGLAQLLDARLERRAARRGRGAARPAGGAQRLVDAGQHLAAAPSAPYVVSRSVRSGSPLAQNAVSAASNASLRRTSAPVLVQHPEARVEPGLERIALQEAQAEAVDRRDPGAVERAREVGAVELLEAGADPRAQLSGGALGVGDDEHLVDREPALEDRADEALDEDGRLPRARARGDEDDAAGLDRGRLLGVRRPRRSCPLHPAHR